MIKLSQYIGVHDRQIKSAEVSWEHFCSKIKEHDVRTDKDGPLISPAVYRESINEKWKLDGYEYDPKDKTKKKAKCWVGPKGEKAVTDLDNKIIRRNVNVETVSMILLDYDKGDSVDAIREKWKDFNHCIYSTFSHSAEKPKFRLVIPFKTPLTSEQFKNAWPFEADGSFDESCKDPSRMYYTPSCPPDKAGIAFFHEVLGKKFFEPKIPKGRPKKEKPKRMDYKTLDAVVWLEVHGAYIGTTGKPNQHWVKCPWAHEHTDGKQGETDTVLWTEPDKWPTFNCSHNSCAKRGTKELMDLWGDADKYCSKELSYRDMQVKTDVKALGYDGENIYYYQCNITGHIVPIRPSEHRELVFYSITADKLYWMKHFADDESGKIDWKGAASTMMGRCHKIGYFHPEMIRGGGVWRDTGRVVAHMGDVLLVDGKENAVSGFKSNFIYEAMVHRVRLVEPLPLSEIQKIDQLAQRFPFTSPADATLLVGMVVCGMLSGILSWRPHVWITGDQSSGKSSILSHFLNPLWAPLGGIFSEGKTTDAGIRQKLRRNSYPVVIDESESDNRGEAERIEALIQMIRSASSDSESRVYKGSVSGKAVEFVVRSCFVLCSISHGLEKAQDKQRFTVLSCAMTQKHIDSWGQLSVDLKKVLTPEFALGLFSHVIFNAETILRSIDIFKSSIVTNVKNADTRLGYQMGSLMACAHYVKTGRLPGEGEAKSIVDSMNVSPQMEREDTSVPMQTLSFLLSYILPMDSGEKRTVGEIVQHAMNDLINVTDNSWNSVLQRYGLRVIDEVLWISSSNPQTLKIFKECGVKGHFGMFALLPGAEKKNIRFSGSGTTRAVGIKIEKENLVERFM